MKCAEADAFLNPYVDGELQGADRDTYERHLRDCTGCASASRLQGRFKAALRGHLPHPEVPERLRRKIQMALAAAPPIATKRWRLVHLLPLLAAGAAATVTLFIAVGGSARRSAVYSQALRTFQAEMPMDVVDSDCAQISRWFRGKVDFTPPPRLAAVGATCQGGRLVTVADRVGAYVVYQLTGGHRVAMLVFPGERDALGTTGRRTSVRGHNVFLDRGQGASVAGFRDRDGLNYIFTGDMDEDALTNVMEASFLQR